MTTARKKDSRPEWQLRLDAMVERGEAIYHPGKPGPLPKLKLAKPITPEELRRIVRAAKRD